MDPSAFRDWPNSGQADQQEGPAPVEGLGDPAAEGEGEEGADRHAHGVEGQGGGALLGRRRIRDQGVGGRRASRLADPDADPRQEKLDIILSEAAQGGEERPQDERSGDDADAIGGETVRVARNRDAENRIDKGEGEARQQAHLRIREIELRLDGAGQNVDDLAIKEVQRVDDEQKPEGVTHLAWSERLSGRTGGWASGRGLGRIGRQCRLHSRGLHPAPRRAGRERGPQSRVSGMAGMRRAHHDRESDEPKRHLTLFPTALTGIGARRRFPVQNPRSGALRD